VRSASSSGRCEITRREFGQAEILQHLDTRGIAIRAGVLAALPLLKRFGVSAAARASCYLYTDTAELDRLAAALRELTRRQGKEWK
jgi:selenocysteine lyase/cysteine desulfurase